MLTLKYYEYYKQCKDIYQVRIELVRFAKKHGIKPAARIYSTSVNTVKKWVRRFDTQGKPGLKDMSRKPHHSPNSMKLRYRYQIQSVCSHLEKHNKRLIASYIKRDNNIPYSLPTILKTMRALGFKRKRRSKCEKKRDLREIKKSLRPFEKIQLDVKYLNDIPEMYYEFIRYRLPQYQFTARCVRTGSLFIAFAREKSITNAMIFLTALHEHCTQYGVSFSNCIIQTDNGSEFTTPWNSLKKSRFTRLVTHLLGSKHNLIPPGAKTWQSDVETSHRLIEDELYAYRMIDSYSHFFAQAHKYIRFFNFNRFNSYKNGSPLSLLKALSPEINTNVLDFKPVLLDDLLNLYIPKLRRVS